MEEKKINKNIEFTDIPEGNSTDIYANLKEKLESVQQFPGIYRFKFIISDGVDKVQDLKKIFPDDEFIEHPSKTGKYLSVTVNKEVKTADEVIDIYKETAKIKGIITL